VPRDIFVPGVGQYDNIGDILLRRPLLDFLREVGPLHIYLGDAPAGYVEGLKLGDSDTAYRSYVRWYLALLSATFRRRAHYVFKPGEIQLTLAGMKEHVGMLPGLVAVRLSGGKVLRIGVGARGPGRLGRLLMRPSIALTHLTLWRDPETRGWLGRGDVMPDLAFGSDLPEAPQLRTLLTVSMRGDRPEPSSEFVSIVRALAVERGLTLVTATQVGRDDERTSWLAQQLPALATNWSGSDHGTQEDRLHDLYSRSEIVVSDRLHVLIASALDGATPLALLTARSNKIDRHFQAAGLPSISVDAWKLDASDNAKRSVETWLGADGVARARSGVLAALHRARTLLSGDDQ